MYICLDQRNGSGCGAENRSGAQACGRCGRSLRFALQFHDPGTLVREYQIVALIGHGNFGAVYEALVGGQPVRRVALKETFDPDSIRSFTHEFAALSRMQHPNLPRYDATFEDRGNGYLVMELVPGQSLDEVVQRRTALLAESQVVGYALQLCDVLGYLHRQSPPLIHRDIKPANIRLTPEGLIKLVDFGISKQGTGATASSRRALTPAYAPLEQYGQGRHTDARSDIYSLGATLYHLLTGNEPLPATERVASNVDPLPPVRAARPDVRQGLSDAVMRAMALTVDKRPASAEALRQLLLGAPPEVARESARSVAERAVQIADGMRARQGKASPRVAAPVGGSAPAGPSVAPLRRLAASRPPVPREATALNWGGFLLSFFWALGHRLWLAAALMFFPPITFIMPFVLLIKGGEWAWRAGGWSDVAAFKAAQRTWTIVGVVVALMPVLLCAAALFAIGLLR